MVVIKVQGLFKGDQRIVRNLEQVEPLRRLDDLLEVLAGQHDFAVGGQCRVNNLLDPHDVGSHRCNHDPALGVFKGVFDVGADVTFPGRSAGNSRPS